MRVNVGFMETAIAPLWVNSESRKHRMAGIAVTVHGYHHNRQNLHATQSVN